MGIETRSLEVTTQGNTDILDITEAVRHCAQETGFANGLVNVFIGGATAGITTLECEPGAVSDLQAGLERIAPENLGYLHNEAYPDGTGHSPVRAALLGPEVTLPLINGALALGTWQRVVLVDFDNRPRRRKIIVQCLG
ncbi:MAG: YjbQ family protein [Planctomycetes bacterium]|nr:YjbQ family protein [Planctomycetota bacterium]